MVVYFSGKRSLNLEKRFDWGAIAKLLPADTTALEAEIDQLVYARYGLTAEEIALVEG